MHNTIFSELEAAMEAELTPKMLDLLVEIARVSVEQDDKEFAAEILALTLQYPMHIETLHFAEKLFSDLETEVCPRVIHDACEQAERITLDDMVVHVLEHSAK